MINRTLIRLKVVQTLYSYLLTRTEFQLLPPPEKQTRDSLAAYSLYINLLRLILQLSDKNISPRQANPLAGVAANRKLCSTQLAAQLAANDDLRGQILKNEEDEIDFRLILPQLHSEIVDSAIFRDYAKKRAPKIPEDVELWTVLLKTLISTSQPLQTALRKSSHFTQAGFEKAIAMVIETLRSYELNISGLVNARIALNSSLKKAYELYMGLFALMIEITDTQDEKLQNAKEKYLPSAEDLNPNTRLTDNRFIAALRENEQFQAYLKENPISWEGDVYLIRQLLDRILASPVYAEYLEKANVTFYDDAMLWRQILKTIILPSEQFEETLEAKSVFWNDDLEIMSTFAEKTIKRWADAGNSTPGFLPMFKDTEDEKFGDRLFNLSVENRETYREYIDSCIDTQNWDADRIAFMDIVIMTVILAELLNFPQIPIPVTMNEYIEIASRYSTPKSSQFISGLMFTLIKRLQEEGILLK